MAQVPSAQEEAFVRNQEAAEVMRLAIKEMYNIGLSSSDIAKMLRSAANGLEDDDGRETTLK